MASSSSSASTRPSFSMADDGLASLAGNPYTHRHPLVSRTGSFASLTSPRSILEPIFNPPHFLDSCSLCKKPLSGNRDIFMYRGDMPFCSEECRKDQIEMDDAMEKSRSIKAIRNKHKESSSSSSSSSSPKQTAASEPVKSRKYPFRAGIAAA